VPDIPKCLAHYCEERKLGLIFTFDIHLERA